MRRTALALLLCLGCGSTDEIDIATTSGAEEVAEALEPLRVTGVDVGPFVQEIRGGCTEGEDACSARGNCEAMPVDCGPADERFRVTAAWASSDDVDLAVVEPAGDTLSFLRPVGASGGRMILPSGRTCVPGSASGVEVATWSGPNAAAGTYTVQLHHFGSCMSGRGTTDVDLTMSAAGRHLGSYRVSLAPTERSEALTVHTE